MAGPQKSQTGLHGTHVELEARRNALIKVLHGHGRDVAQLLEDLVRPRRRASAPMACALHQPQHPEDFVYHLAGDETAEVHVHVLHEGHTQQGQPGLYAGEDLTVAGKRVRPTLRLAPGKLFLDSLEALGMEPLSAEKALVQQPLAARVEVAANPSVDADFIIGQKTEDVLHDLDWEALHSEDIVAAVRF